MAIHMGLSIDRIGEETLVIWSLSTALGITVNSGF